MKVPTIRQKPWYIGLISSLVVDRSLRNVGLTAEVQNFDRAAYDASIPIVPAATRGGVVGTDFEYVARDGFRNAARWYAPPVESEHAAKFDGRAASMHCLSRYFIY